MALLKKIRNLFRPSDTKTEPRYQSPLFADMEIQMKIARKGYAVAPLLDAEEVEALKSDFFRMLDMLPEPLPDIHWSSGRVADPAIRNFCKEAVERVYRPKLETYFLPGKTDLIGGIFLAKKVSATSKLTAHQDSSHVDERTHFGIYAWCPLVDVDEQTGCMYALPYSHLIGNRHRSLNVPWQFAGLESTINKFLIPIPMKAGEVLFFDGATIHYSSDNLGEAIRPAVNYYIKPADSPFLHHYMDEKSPPGKVEVFSVTPDFFYDEDFQARPPAKYPFLGYEDHTAFELDPEGFEKMYRELLKRVGVA